jgi:hypothetical protein
LFVSADSECADDRLGTLGRALQSDLELNVSKAGRSADGLSLVVTDTELDPQLTRELLVSATSAPTVCRGLGCVLVDGKGGEISRPDGPGGAMASRWRFSSGAVIDTTVEACDDDGLFVACKDHDPNNYRAPGPTTIRAVRDPSRVLAVCDWAGYATGLFVTDTHVYLALVSLSETTSPAAWVAYARNGASLVHEYTTTIAVPDWFAIWVEVRDCDPAHQRLILRAQRDLPFFPSFYLYDLSKGHMSPIKAASWAYAGFLDRRLFDTVR